MTEIREYEPITAIESIEDYRRAVERVHDLGDAGVPDEHVDEFKRLCDMIEAYDNATLPPPWGRNGKLWMGMSIEPIKALADWWAGVLSRNHELARGPFRNALMGVIKQRSESVEDRIVLDVDYEPNPLLEEALKLAGIPWDKYPNSLPQKTSSCIELDGRTWVWMRPDDPVTLLESVTGGEDVQD